MKASIAISLFILAAAFLLGWRGHTTLIAERSEHERLTAQAAGLGLLALDPEHPEKGLRITKRTRADKEAEAHAAAGEFIALARELEALAESGKEADEALQIRLMDFVARMKALDPSQLRILIAEFRDTPGLSDRIRAGLLGYAIQTLADDNPKAAMEVFMESEGVFNKELGGPHVVTQILAKWAGQDPAAAMEWLRANGVKYPESIAYMKAGLVRGAAALGIAEGFDMLRQLDLERPEVALRELAATVSTPAERTDFLNHFRNYVESSPPGGAEEAMRQLNHLGKGIAGDGFEQGSRWIEDNRLSEKEISALAGSIAWQAKSAEKGKWIEWMGEKLPAGERGDSIASVMENWTNNDYRAAGEWLAATPDGPARAPAVSTYAVTVARYDPQAAVQWALTLPAGERRRETLEVIHLKWPVDTEENRAQRAAFAAQHGIE